MSRIVEVVAQASVRASQTDGSTYGPGTHEVPDDVAEDLLSHRYVQEADQSDGDDATDWDAADFVDRHHATVRNDVEDGVVDDMLQAVEDAENDRDSPRDSVLQSINDRQEQVQG
jgi:hypothetical protein